MTRRLLVIFSLTVASAALAAEDYNAIFEAAVEAVEFDQHRMQFRLQRQCH